MPRSLDSYLDRITSEHNGQPDFVATVTALLQPLVDMQAVVEHLPADFDLDVAVGAQLDAIGVRVNRNRFVDIPYSVYFSWDTAGLGWDEGFWWVPGDPLTSMTTLADDPYRTLLRAVIAANQWDGTIPGAYVAWDTLFAGTPYGILIQDHGDLSMDLVLIGPSPDAITRALFTAGELDLKPAGVSLRHYVPSVYPGAVPGGTPLFGFDVQNGVIAGWDTGAWASLVSVE